MPAVATSAGAPAAGGTEYEKTVLRLLNQLVEGQDDLRTQMEEMAFCAVGPAKVSTFSLAASTSRGFAAATGNMMSARGTARSNESSARGSARPTYRLQPPDTARRITPPPISLGKQPNTVNIDVSQPSPTGMTFSPPPASAGGPFGSSRHKFSRAGSGHVPRIGAQKSAFPTVTSPTNHTTTASSTLAPPGVGSPPVIPTSPSSVASSDVGSVEGNEATLPGVPTATEQPVPASCDGVVTGTPIVPPPPPGTVTGESGTDSDNAPPTAPAPAAPIATSPEAKPKPKPKPLPEVPKPKGLLGLINRAVYADSLARNILHGALTLVACIEFITITATMAYKYEASKLMTAYYWILLVVATLLLAAEMMLNFNTAVHHNKWEIIDDVKLSRKLYRKRWFWWDFFVTFPWDLIALGILGTSIVTTMSLRGGVNAFSILVLIRLLHIVRIPTYFRRRNPILDPPRWVNAVFFIALSLLVIHSLGVVWMILASKDEQGVEAKGFEYQYIMAINWAFQSFVHGKSDVYGHYTVTALYGLLVKIIGFLIVATMEAKLAEFFVNHDPFHGLARKRQQQLASMIIHNNVPWDVQKNIMSIYPSLLQANVRDYYNIMNDLPPFLSAQITKYIKMRLISAVPMFAQTSEGCREALATVLCEDMLAPGYDIVTRGDVATSMYFISNGMVEVLILNPEGEEICLTTLKEGSWFGEIALLQDTKRTASVRAATAVKVFRLEKADFNVLAEDFPELRAKIQEVAMARMKQMAKKDDPKPENDSKPASPPGSSGALLPPPPTASVCPPSARPVAAVESVTTASHPNSSRSKSSRQYADEKYKAVSCKEDDEDDHGSIGRPSNTLNSPSAASISVYNLTARSSVDSPYRMGSLEQPLLKSQPLSCTSPVQSPVQSPPPLLPPPPPPPPPAQPTSSRGMAEDVFLEGSARNSLAVGGDGSANPTIPSSRTRESIAISFSQVTAGTPQSVRGPVTATAAPGGGGASTNLEEVPSVDHHQIQSILGGPSEGLPLSPTQSVGVDSALLGVRNPAELSSRSGQALDIKDLPRVLAQPLSSRPDSDTGNHAGPEEPLMTPGSPNVAAGFDIILGGRTSTYSTAMLLPSSNSGLIQLSPRDEATAVLDVSSGGAASGAPGGTESARSGIPLFGNLWGRKPKTPVKVDNKKAWN